MKRRIIWLVVSCLIVVALLLASCGPAEVEEEEVTPPPVEEELAPPKEEGEELTAPPEEEVVTEEEEKVEPVLTPSPEPSEVIKSGWITEDETWSGEVYIPTGVEVAEDITLTIEPGTVVRFKHWRYGCTEPDERGSLIVRGTLRAVGTDEKPIRFTSDAPEPRHKDWQGIIFYEPSVNNILDHCIVEYANAAVFATDADFTLSNSIVRWTGNVAFMRSSPTITHNRIYGGHVEAIGMEGYSYPTITYNTIWGTATGIFVSVDSHATISHNIIRNITTSGIQIMANSSATIEYNTITDCYTGINIFPGSPTSKITLKNNNIYNNDDFNLRLETDEDLAATENWWGTSDKEQIESKLFGRALCEPYLTAEADIGEVAYDYQNDETYPYEPYLNYPRIARDGIGEDNYIYIYPDDKTRKVLDSWHSGGDFPSGIAWDGYHLWVCTFGGQGDIRKFDASGNLLDVFPSPGPWPYGLAFDGKYLWCLDYSEAKVYQLDSSGEVIGSIPAPGKNPIGLAYDGECLWTMPWDGTGTAYRFDMAGNIVDSMVTPGWSGLAWDRGHLWVSEGEGMRIYEMDPSSGNVVRIITSSGDKTFDITWQGPYLWTCEWANEIVEDMRIVKMLPAEEIVTIDGLRDDWQGFFPLLSDSKGDATDEKTDIKAMYSFTDNGYFYLMIETYADTVGTFDHVGVEVDIDGDGKPEYRLDSTLCRGTPSERQLGLGAGITDFRGREVKYSYRKWASFLYTLSNMKDVFEFKVPLSFIEDHTEFNIKCSFMDESDGEWFALDETDWAYVSGK